MPPSPPHKFGAERTTMTHRSARAWRMGVSVRLLSNSVLIWWVRQKNFPSFNWFLWIQGKLLALRMKGSPEQVAVFPQPLFLFQFIRAWNKHQGDPNFVKQQLGELEWFDATQTATLQVQPTSINSQQARCNDLESLVILSNWSNSDIYSVHNRPMHVSVLSHNVVRKRNVWVGPMPSGLFPNSKVQC